MYIKKDNRTCSWNKQHTPGINYSNVGSTPTNIDRAVGGLESRDEKHTGRGQLQCQQMTCQGDRPLELTTTLTNQYGSEAQQWTLPLHGFESPQSQQMAQQDFKSHKGLATEWWSKIQKRRLNPPGIYDRNLRAGSGIKIKQNAWLLEREPVRDLAKVEEVAMSAVAPPTLCIFSYELSAETAAKNRVPLNGMNFDLERLVKGHQ